MCEICKRAQEFVEKITEIEHLLEKDAEIHKEAYKLLREPVGLQLYVPDVVVVFVKRLPLIRAIPKLVCDDVWGEIMFSGYYVNVRSDLNHSTTMYLGGRTTLYELLVLYYIERCNPGFLDKVIEELRKRNEECGGMIEKLRQVYVMLRITLE